MSYKVDEDFCTACRACMEACPSEAVSIKGTVAKVDPALCLDCGTCESACPMGAIKPE